MYGTSEHLAECPDLGPECASSPPPVPYYHHVELLASDITLDAAYGLTPWLAAEARLVLRIVDTTPTYREQDGTPKLVPNDIHHHDTTLVGPGDPWLVARFAGRFGKLTTAARLGITFPLGATQPDPYALGAEGEWHEHTQLGTGTFVPIVGVGASYAFDPIVLSGSFLGFFSFYENDDGFRAPARYFGAVRGSWPLLEQTLIPYVTVDVAGETEEIWHGSPGLEGSNVRADLLLGGGIQWEFTKDWMLDFSLRGRAARFTSARGFEYPGVAQLAISTHFGGGARVIAAARRRAALSLQAASGTTAANFGCRASRAEAR